MDAENLKAKMRSGRERGLAIGHAYTGCAPYGYKLINKQLYIDEKEKFIDNYIINSNNAEEDYIDKLVNDLKW